jgi:protein-disulfide isomerase
LLASLDGKYLFTDAVPLDESGSQTESGSANENSERVDIDYEDAFFIGDENAPVTIVEFSDYECPFCAKFYSESLSSIKKNYIETGKAKLVFMDYPLEFHPNAQKAAEAARCFAAGGGNYFDYHDLLFEKQSSGFSNEKFKKWARDLGADGNKFDICLDSGTYAADVKEDFDYGASLGVSGTPAFFVNGISISGAQPYSVFEKVIESELEGN